MRDELNQDVSRTDLRFALDRSGELWITTKQDGFIRRLNASSGSGPGRTPATMTLDKGVGGQIDLTWQASVCSGASDFGIFEGTIGVWSSHESVTCIDADGDLRESVLPGVGNRYFLVVPIDASEEGSYGVDAQGVERSTSTTGFCRASQRLACL